MVWMDIEYFVATRKASGLSQSELAEGICTQATLSRFENNGQVPSLKILIKLCTRLNLSISEIFPKMGFKNSKTIELMDKVEFRFITSEYDQAQQLLDQITPLESELDSESYIRYLYLKGFLMIFQSGNITDILYIFDQILLDESIKHFDIFSLLAYTGIGMVYSRERDFEKAAFYFNKVNGKVYFIPTDKTEDTWRVLNIVFHSGEFYANINELDESNALLEYVINICAENHVTYYLARAAYQLALNSIAQGKSHAEIVELIQDARAYAKINRNRLLLKKINELDLKINNIEKQ